MNARRIILFYELARDLLGKKRDFDRWTKQLGDNHESTKGYERLMIETHQKILGLVQKDNRASAPIGLDERWKILSKVLTATKRAKKYRMKVAEALLLQAFKDLSVLAGENAINTYEFLQLEVGYTIPYDYRRCCFVVVSREEIKKRDGRPGERTRLTLEVSNSGSLGGFLKLKGITKSWSLAEGIAFIVEGPKLRYYSD